MGGTIAIHYATLHPDKVEKMILLSPGALNARVRGRTTAPPLPAWIDIAQVITPRIVFQKLLEGGFGDKTKLKPALIDQWWELMRLKGQRRAEIDRNRQYISGDIDAKIHTITTPAVGTTFTASFTCNLLAEATALNIAPGPGGSITLSWAAPPDPCLSLGPAVYHVYASSMARPLSAPGQFPLDPSFTLVASTAINSVTITPAAGPQFYLVRGIGSDGNEGPVGAYGR